MRLPFLALLLLCLRTQFVHGQYQVVELSPPGVQIDKLPGYNILHPNDNVLDIDLTLTPATIISYLGNGSLLYRFNAPIYLDTSPGSSGKAYIFGPTIRFKRGGTANIKLTNNLTNPQSNNTMQFDIGITNFHTHGLHDSPGQLSQGPPTYTTGDNIFVYVLPGEVLAMKNFIDDDHLPGLHWYHPHKHGSTSSQAFTSNGLILVDDDDAWLPDDGGCAPFKRILNSSPDYILHIELLTFGPPVASNISDANYQKLSEEGNSTLCCGGSPLNDLDGLGEDEDIAFINGGYQPMIPATSGKWQRWRLAHTGYKRFMVLQIIDPVTSAPTKACEIHLIAKDGVYLLEIPRRTDYIFLSAGNRAEVLVRCFGPPGKEYILSSGQLPLPIGGGSDFQAATLSHQQPIMATIRMSENTGGSNDTDLVNKGCTPLRPSYASNLLNAPTDKIFYDANATFGFTPSGCLIGGKAFEYPEPYPLQMPLGKVVEWSIADLTFHPWHAHVSPFQIKTLSKEGLFPNMTYTNWFEDGDFHDTLQLPMVNFEGVSTTLRTQPGPYGGYAVAHCHFLQHEDAGCMRVMRFSCVDGDVQPFDCSPYFTYPVLGTWKAGPTPPTPLPSPSPPTPKPCSYAQGTYQLIPQGRSKCAPKSEYLVYSGGNSTSCKSNSVKLQQGGTFDSKRSKWAIEATQAGKSTPILTVGRGCSSGKENGLAGSSKSSNTTVFLAGTGHRWTMDPVSTGDCSTVKIIDSSRYNDGSPAYLTVSSKCGEKSVTLAKLKAVGDTQSWKIKKV